MGDRTLVFDAPGGHVFGRWTPEALGLSNSPSAAAANMARAASLRADETLLLTPGHWPFAVGTIRCRVIAEAGAVLKPTGAVTLSGSVAANLYTWIDLSLGGTVALAVAAGWGTVLGDQQWRLTAGAGSPNIVAGYSGNSIAAGVNVRANVIAGGGYVGAPNVIDGPETRYGTIGGGYDNHLDGLNSTTDIDAAASTIAGGAHHLIQCTHGTIGGGSYGVLHPGCDYGTIVGGTHNEVTGEYGTVLGGLYNKAGRWAVAGGRYCVVSGEGSFGMCMGKIGETYTLAQAGALGFHYDYYFLTGGAGTGKVGIGGFDHTNLPIAQLDIGSPGLSDVPGVGLVTRYSSRFGLRVQADDVTMVLDRYTGGGWAVVPSMWWNRDTGWSGAFGGFLTGGKVGIGTFDQAHLPIANLDVGSQGASDVPGDKLIARFASRFGLRLLTDDVTMALDRYNANVWQADPVMSWNRSTGRVGIGTAAPTSKLQIIGLVTHADNAAAVAGGLTVGAFYHTATGEVRIVV